MSKPRFPRAKLLAELQDLVGNIKADYMNDRSPSRADKLLPAMDRAFEICVILRSQYKK